MSKEKKTQNINETEEINNPQPTEEVQNPPLSLASGLPSAPASLSTCTLLGQTPSWTGFPSRMPA